MNESLTARLLSSRLASRLVILFCIAFKSVLIFYYSFIGRDKILNIAASNNLLEGKGWTIGFFQPDQINKEILEPFCHWPPGYGLLLTPFQLIFGKNIFLSTTVFEIICFIAFLLLCRAILKNRGIVRSHLNIYTLLIGFFPYEFIETSLGTDLPAICFLLGFLYCITRTWQADLRKKNIRWGIMAGLCLFFAGFIRYPNVPVAIFIAIVVLGMGYWKKDKQSLPGLWVTALTSITLLVAAMLVQTSNCGRPFFIIESEKGFFTNNLQYWHPAAIASFANPSIVAGLLEKFTHVAYTVWTSLMNKLNLLIYASLLVVAISWLSKLKRKASSFDMLKFAGLVLSFSFVAELVYLSVTNAIYTTAMGSQWTFIAEARYYAFVVVFIQLVFFIEYSALELAGKGKRLLLIFLMTVMTISCLHQFYFATKIACHYKGMKSVVTREQDYVFFEDLLKKTIKENPGKDIVVAATDLYYPLLASFHDQKGVRGVDLAKLNAPGSILLFVLLPSEQTIHNEYTSREGVELIKTIGGVTFYKQAL